jgi:hypothetical protein
LLFPLLVGKQGFVVEDSSRFRGQTDQSTKPLGDNRFTTPVLKCFDATFIGRHGGHSGQSKLMVPNLWAQRHPLVHLES